MGAKNTYYIWYKLLATSNQFSKITTLCTSWLRYLNEKKKTPPQKGSLDSLTTILSKRDDRGTQVKHQSAKSQPQYHLDN